MQANLSGCVARAGQYWAVDVGVLEGLGIGEFVDGVWSPTDSAIASACYEPDPRLDSVRHGAGSDRGAGRLPSNQPPSAENIRRSNRSSEPAARQLLRGQADGCSDLGSRVPDRFTAFLSANVGNHLRLVVEDQKNPHAHAFAHAAILAAS